MASPSAVPTPAAVRPVGTFPLRGTVPYITAWSSEGELPGRLVARRGRLGYEDELPFDRDRFGVLWRRVGVSPGKGRPEFGKVHSLRQRRAMQRVLCQVCGGSAAGDRDGVLWLMGSAGYEEDPWPAPIESPHPPVCLSCAVLAVRLCPHLCDQYTAVRARRFQLSGAYGVLYVLDAPGPKAVGMETLDLDSGNITWLRASQLVMRLVDYRVVDLDAEAAAHGLAV